MKKAIFAIVVLAMLLGYTPKGSCSPNSHTAGRYRFQYVQPPLHIVAEHRAEYMRDHYWDRFDFADSGIPAKADTTDMVRAYAAYVANFVGPTNQAPIRKLLQRASSSKVMFDYFVMLSEKVLHDPNSPLRSDELYIAVLEEQIASPLLDKYEKMAPKYDLRIASQNRIGHTANDFDYTTKSGKTENLFSLSNDFVIVYINNPGCAMCRDITEALKRSPIINDLLHKGGLKIVAIYPDENLNEWHKHYADIPSAWINGYDKGCRISRENLYNTNAIPALYLLDKNKVVLVKDSTNVAELEYVLSQQAAPKR